VVTLRANTVVVDTSDEAVVVVGFADESGGQYRDGLVIQRTREADEQDVAPGMDRVHIERQDQSSGGYGGIVEFTLYRDHASLAVDSEMARKLGDRDFAILFQLEDDRFEELRAGLRLAFRRDETFHER
jgi:hypothetical protein